MTNEAYATTPAGTMRAADPEIRKIGTADLTEALRLGWADFKAKPSFAVFLVIIYPIVGLVLLRLTAGEDIFPILFPLMSGFAILGPFAAIGIYEISRRKEAGLDTHWARALDVVRHQSIGSLLALGAALMLIFIAWLVAAWVIYEATLGSGTFRSAEQFIRDTLGTGPGWAMIIIGNAVGLVFAVLAFTISVVSFPFILDRHASVGQAVKTSVRAVTANPGTMMLWGLMIATGLLIGTIPFFIGLAIVLPVIAHASWHLYRKVVGP